MKKILSIAVVMFMTTGLFAQQNTELEIIRSKFKLEKKAVVADYLKLSNEDAGKFWPIYNKYEEERTALGDRQMKLITDYVNDKHVGSIPSSDAMVKESSEIQKKLINLREKYYGEVKTGVNATVGLNFFQIEDQIATTVKAALWEQLGK